MQSTSSTWGDINSGKAKHKNNFSIKKPFSFLEKGRYSKKMRNSSLLLMALVATITWVQCKPPLPIKLEKIQPLKTNEEEKGAKGDFSPITTNEDKEFILPPAVFDTCAFVKCKYPSRCVDGVCGCNYKCKNKKELPFCGEDGKEYKNMCEAKKSMCEAGTEIYIVPGKCQGMQTSSFQIHLLSE